MSPLDLLTANWWRAAALAMTSVAAFLLVRIEGLPVIGGGLAAELEASRLEAQVARRDARSHFAAHVQTIRSYRAAQAAAEKAETARAARVTIHQQRISDDVVQDHARDLAELRARYERLRQQGAAGARGAAGGIEVPGVPAAAVRAAQEAGDHRLPLEDALTASEQALQLEALIDWVERQAQVEPN